jgi:hypothetical protein
VRAERDVDADFVKNASVHCEQAKSATHFVFVFALAPEARVVSPRAAFGREARLSQEKKSGAARTRSYGPALVQGKPAKNISSRGWKESVFNCGTTRCEAEASAALHETEDADAPLEFGGVSHEKRE